MRIVITAGHSNKDPGAVAGGRKEADFCADMRNYVAYYLTNWGYKVETDGQGSANAPLAQAVALARGADVAVEFHLNASTSPVAYGVEVLCQPRHKKLAQDISKAITDVTGSRLRGEYGYKPEDSGQHKRLGFVQAGGLVVELEFISNPSRMDALVEKRWVVAKAIAETIKSHIGDKK